MNNLTQSRYEIKKDFQNFKLNFLIVLFLLFLTFIHNSETEKEKRGMLGNTFHMYHNLDPG